MLRLCVFMLSLSLFSCQTSRKKDGSEQTGKNWNKSQIIAELDKGSVEANNTATVISIAEPLLKNRKSLTWQGKLAVGFALSELVDPVAKVLKLFLDDDTTFSCKDEASNGLNCSVTFNDKKFNARIRSGAGTYLLHFCSLKDSIMVNKTDSRFWETLSSLATAKQDLYKDKDKETLNGVVLLLKGDDDFHVERFRASLGLVKDGSEEYKEFAADDCAAYYNTQKTDMKSKEEL